MIHISSDIRISSTIRAGSVYYFSESSFSSNASHYFIVIDKEPGCDEVFLLVVSSSRIEKAKWRTEKRGLPAETLVEIGANEYIDFTKNSIIDCNCLFRYSINELAAKLSGGKLEIKREMDDGLIQRS